LLTVNVNIERARRPGTYSDWNIELAFDGIFEAHGLDFDVVSKETAFDLDTHINASEVKRI
jgi:hypothetical protein